MTRAIPGAVCTAMALTLLLAGCGGEDEPVDPNAPVTITLAGWSLSSTPEFKTLADGFRATHPNVTVELKEYDAANYDTQMIADLAAGTAPDVYVLKNLKNFYTYQSGGQLLDVSDAGSVLGALPALAPYQVDGKTYAVPYRQDSWVLYYNKDLFDTAKVPHPTGDWTWDDYAAMAKRLTAGLKAAGSTATGAYQHVWQSTAQGFALAQTPGADLLSGDYAYLKPYYQRSLDLQAAGAQPTFGTANTNKLTYQAQFGKQQSAMLLMGTWYVATLLNQRTSGDADTFEWGIAPAPQHDRSTTGTSATPVTFGDPTGMGINPKISKSKVPAAQAFLAYVAGEDAGKALAGIGITPARATAPITETLFALDGVPDDALSKFAYGTHEIRPENPVSRHTTGIQNVLADLHSAVMSDSKSLDEAITEAQARARSEVLTQ
ncbi:ABC transporter substrate-binding protein [Micromonospora craniellae]|uniref:Sugar ABC transporter substrate-binding protein n=1 Tax=Micromonospora craniellae TaxID=2294034 RepID=A0A372G007_9ACTN|nr:sugar ABC transporter substrate-binding protein [Micromonospora craniellae]QOC91370.1 sugar ABC transporter substrate-binding protein [Micromonospora craniellae]RFS46303.1 sugar ABC transporter substrate-binding protein [Micromonospora craniellae]